jgi:sec-independent protein translocase protein TatB
MSLGPEKIILILVVALIVFGPQRLPEIARQVGAAVRELRHMQDMVRGELEQVLHPEYTAPSPGTPELTPPAPDSDHGDYATEDATDDGFSGPRSFS